MSTSGVSGAAASRCGIGLGPVRMIGACQELIILLGWGWRAPLVCPLSLSATPLDGVEGEPLKPSLPLLGSVQFTPTAFMGDVLGAAPAGQLHQ